MEIEESTRRTRSKRPTSKPSNPPTRSDPKRTVNHEPPPKSSFKKTSSRGQTGPINRIEEMIEAIETFPKRRKNADKTECKFCHSCKTQCEKIYLLHCSLEDCFLYFCLRCMNKKFKTSLMNISVIMKSEIWSCPSCLGECPCQTCQIKTSLEHGTTKAPSNNHHKNLEEFLKEESDSVESSPINYSVNVKIEKTKEKKELSPDLRGDMIRLSRKSTTRPKDELILRKKSRSPPPTNSSSAERREAKHARMATIKKKKPKITRMTTRGSEKINRKIMKAPTKEEKNSPSMTEPVLKKEATKVKISKRDLSPIKQNMKKRDPSPSVDEEIEASPQIERTQETNSEKSSQPELKKEAAKVKISKMDLSPIKKNPKKRSSSPSVDFDSDGSYQAPRNGGPDSQLLNRKISKNLKKRSSSPSVDEKSNDSYQPSRNKEPNSKLLNTKILKGSSNLKKRSSPPSVDKGSDGSFQPSRNKKPSSKLLNKKILKGNGKKTSSNLKKRSSPPSVDEKSNDSYQPSRNKESNSKLLNKKIAKETLKKSSPQRRRPDPKPQKKRTPRTRRLRDAESDESEDKIDEEDPIVPLRKMRTRFAEKIVPVKRMASTSSESEKSYGSFDIKKMNEAKTPKERKDEWNENNKRVLHRSSGEEGEFILEEEEEYTYKADKSSSLIEQELSPKKKVEKMIIEKSQCHYCMEMKSEGMTCSDKSCHMFFCSHCISKHPDEDFSKIVKMKNWKCLVCEDRCTCIDCLKLQFRPKSQKKEDISNQEKSFQEYVAKVKHARNEIVQKEVLDLFDDKLEGYTLKKKKENGVSPVDEKKEEVNEEKPITEQSQVKLTGMLSEKNALINPDGIVDVNECQWYLAQSVSNNN